MSIQTLSIGDLQIVFKDCALPWAKPHGDFICNDENLFPDLELDLEVDKNPQEFQLDSKARIIFDSGGVWRLLDCQNSSQNEQILEVFNQHDSKDLAYFRARYNLDEKKGVLEVCSNPYGLGKTIHPFQHPLDQLLWIQLLAINQGFILHSFAFVHEKKAYCFAGVSGAGKTTMAKLFRQKFPKAIILSDDRVIIRKKGDEFYAYGTPWHGDGKEWSASSAKVEQIFILNHGEKNSLKPLNKMDALSALLIRSFPTLYHALGMENTLDVFADLVQEIPVYSLEFVPHNEVFSFLEKELSVSLKKAVNS